MGFLPDKAAFKKYVIVDNEFSMQNVTTLKPDVLSKYFRPWMPAALITQIEGYSAESNAIKKSSFNKMENALAKLILFDYCIQGQLKIQDGSITRIETADSKTAYKNQILDLREALEETALTVIEELIQILDDNTVIFTSWSTAPGKTSADKLLVKTAKEFNEIERLFRPYSTFNFLIPTQLVCLDLYIRSRFLADLVTEVITNDSLSPEKTVFRGYLQNAIANFTIATAIKKNLVKLSRDGVRQIQQDENTGSSIQSKADNESTGKVITEFMDTGHRYINLADSYISSNLEAFDLTDRGDTFEKSTPWM